MRCLRIAPGAQGAISSPDRDEPLAAIPWPRKSTSLLTFPTRILTAAGACRARGPAAPTRTSASTKRSRASPSAAASTCCSSATAPASRTPGPGSRDEAVRWGIAWPRHDMSPVITCMSRVTQHVGFGLTYASTFMHPFYVARLFNSLDHVTGGRIAFNVITSTPRCRRRELRLRRADGARRRATTGWKSSSMSAARCGTASSRTRFIWDRESGVVGRSGEGAGDQSRGQVLQGPRPAQPPALAAGPSGPDPGRRLAARHQRLAPISPITSSAPVAAQAGQVGACASARRGAGRARPRPGTDRHRFGASA